MKHAQILTSIWQDKDFVALSPPAKLTYFLLLSQQNRSIVGALPYLPTKWARQLSFDLDELDAALDELERRRFVMLDGHTHELLIRTVVRHDPARGKAIIAVWAAIERVESEALRRQIARELPPSVLDSTSFRPPSWLLDLRQGES